MPRGSGWASNRFPRIGYGTDARRRGVDGMRRFTSTGLALLALVAISGTVAGTASAAAPKLDLTWLEGTSDLEPGDEFKMVNYSGITLQTSSGSITCPGEQGFIGTVLTNSEPTDTVDLHYSYGGIGGDALCASTVPLKGEVTAVEVGGSSLPLDLGVLSLSAKGKARLLPKPGVPPDFLVIESYYPHHGVEREECLYAFAKLNGTVTLEPEEFFELTRRRRR